MVRNRFDLNQIAAANAQRRREPGVEITPVDGILARL
jgi:hypothetical protein